MKTKKYRLRTEVRFGGIEPEGGLGVVCSKCKKFGPVHELYGSHVQWKRQRWCRECWLTQVQERLVSWWQRIKKWLKMREEGPVKDQGGIGKKMKRAKRIKEEAKIREAKEAGEKVMLVDAGVAHLLMMLRCSIRLRKYLKMMNQWDECPILVLYCTQEQGD